MILRIRLCHLLLQINRRGEISEWRMETKAASSRFIRKQTTFPTKSSGRWHGALEACLFTSRNTTPLMETKTRWTKVKWRRITAYKRSWWRHLFNKRWNRHLLNILMVRDRELRVLQVNLYKGESPPPSFFSN